MKCPGQDTRYWRAGDIFETRCPHCGETVEFFKDDSNRKCGACGGRVLNPKIDYGCAAHCKFAAQCLGELPPEALAQRADLLKDRVADEVKRYYGSDARRIGHAERVARYAGRVAGDTGGDAAVVFIAARLRDIGTRQAGNRVAGSSARGLLEGLGAGKELIDEVCDIISRDHSPGPGASVNYKAVHDAERLAALKERQSSDALERRELEAIIDSEFLTGAGKALARDMLLPVAET